jgi:putative ABC transport system substrate-binding protein
MSKKIFIALAVIIVLVIVLGIILWQRYVIDEPTGKGEIYRIGLLQMAPTVAENMEGFKIGMEELGFEEGVNVEYIYRDAEGNLDLLDQYAQELVAAEPDLIFVNTSPATAVIKEATKETEIPVVFSMVADPLGAGFVKSIRSSDNNLTGTACAYIDIAPKRLAVLKEINPTIKKVLVFYRPADKSGGPATEKILENASGIGIEVVAVPIEAKEDIKSYLDRLGLGEVDAIMDPADSMATAGLMEWGVEKAIELRIPLLMLSKGECEKGALASFGVDYIDLGKQSSLIANQVLMGIEPTDIPVEMPRKFFFAINQITAEKIGLDIPEGILQRVDLIVK